MQRTASSTEAPASRRKIQGTLADVRVRAEEIAITGTGLPRSPARCAESRSVAIKPTTPGSYTSFTNPSAALPHGTSEDTPTIR